LARVTHICLLAEGDTIAAPGAVVRTEADVAPDSGGIALPDPELRASPLTRRAVSLGIEHRSAEHDVRGFGYKSCLWGSERRGGEKGEEDNGELHDCEWLEMISD